MGNIKINQLKGNLLIGQKHTYVGAFKKGLEIHKKLLIRIAKIILLLSGVLNWFITLCNLLNSDFEHQSRCHWGNIYIEVFYMNLQWFQKISGVASSGWIEKYGFHVCIFILTIVYAVLKIYEFQWTCISIILLVISSCTTTYALWTVAVHCYNRKIKNQITEVSPQSQRYKCITTIAILMLCFIFVAFLTLFFILLVLRETQDEEGHADLLVLLSYVILFGLLVIECDDNSLRKGKFMILIPALSFCGILCLLMTPKVIKKWDKVKIIPFWFLMGLIISIYIANFFLYLKKLVRHAQKANETNEHLPNP
ncbi:uncharacterized protein [Euwallacea fornicatus]|uniref:uncharacterized protein n=1 Tax=Euwallacea fornicatus TaxID=995702 RepID=UPI00338DD70B